MAFHVPSLPDERWAPVPGTAGKYIVSDQGRVVGTRGLLAHQSDRDGYPRVCVPHNGGARRSVHVHVLVASAFLGPRPEGHDVAHVDDDRANPRLENLLYITHAENMASVDVSGERNGRAKLTEKDVAAIRASSARNADLSRSYEMSSGQISLIRSGKRWATAARPNPDSAESTLPKREG